MPLLPYFKKKVLESDPKKTEMIIIEPEEFQQHLGRDMADPQGTGTPIVDISFPSWNIDITNTTWTTTNQHRREDVFTGAVMSGSQKVGEALPENWSLSCEPRPLIEPISVVQVYSPSDHMLAKINILKHKGRAGSRSGLLSLPLQMLQNQIEPEIQPFWASCTEDSPSISDFEDLLDSLLKMQYRS